jgi:hypothetical protein
MKYIKLIQEIEYYESKGFHKLADKLTLNLQKMARDIDTNDPLWRTISQQYLNITLNQFPQCMVNNQVPQVFEDKKDAILGYMSQGMTFDDAMKKETANLDQQNTPENWDDCMKAMTKAFGLENKNKGSETNQAPQNTPNVQATPQSRAVPQM